MRFFIGIGDIARFCGGRNLAVPKGKFRNFFVSFLKKINGSCSGYKSQSDMWHFTIRK